MRTRSDVPVIMLTTEDTVVDKAIAHRLGADDGVTIPCAWRELAARILTGLGSAPQVDSSEAPRGAEAPPA